MQANRKLKVIGVPWHVAHQAELYKNPLFGEVHMIANSVRKWGRLRALPPNMKWVPHYDPAEKYDLAILHVDQQCTDPRLGKSRLYRELNEQIQGIPKVVINHGTPYWPEAYESDVLVTRMQGLIGDNWMVVNSHQAAEQWGQMGKGTTAIIHGMETAQWNPLPKEPRVVTMLSPAGLDAYYNRQLLAEVKDILKQRGIQHVHAGVDTEPMDQVEFAKFLGRSLVYFNPTLESPMPRSRTEAMLCGCCIVTLPNHGAEKFITPGVNGFHVPNNPKMAADLITQLVERNYQLAVQCGEAGRRTALELFSLERFHSDWTDLLTRVLA